MNNILILVLLYSTSQVDYCHGHATLFKPQSRANKMSQGMDDYGINCGEREGFKKNKGKCGICGDPWDDEPPRKHEAPGQYSGGKVTGQYQPGDIIEVGVRVSAGHWGFFTFHICANNRTDGVTVRDPDQSSCEKLKIKDSSISTLYDGKKLPPYIQDDTTQLPTDDTAGEITAKLELPGHIKWCNRCLLQWTYTTGVDSGKGENCKPEVGEALGCGLQETFRACADVSIMSEEEEKQVEENTPPPKNPVVEIQSVVSQKQPDNDPRTCVALGPWAGNTDMDDWCKTNCNWTPSYCPANRCKC